MVRNVLVNSNQEFDKFIKFIILLLLLGELSILFLIATVRSKTFGL